MTEARIQADFFKAFWNKYPVHRKKLFHIPNGGTRNPIEAAKFKAMGVIAGVPDLFFAHGNATYHGLFLELKKPGERPRKDQIELHKKLSDEGYCVYVCDNSAMAMTLIENYLKL